MKTGEMFNYKVTQYGLELHPSKYKFEENTKMFSSLENDLILDFSTLSNCTFVTGSNCTFVTGSNCTFNTDSSCTFNTGPNCTFYTGHSCTFNTDAVCVFKTGSSCTFDVGHSCTFDVGHSCTFNTGSNCTFNTGSHCTFDTSSYCTFDTSSNCTFVTGSRCTFDTSSYCTFSNGSHCTFITGSHCVIIRRDIFQIIQPLVDEIIQLCPYDVQGFLVGGYLNRDKSLGEHIIADGILSRIVAKKGNVYKVQNYIKNIRSDEVTFLIEVNGVFSHGKTLKEAKDSLVYKNSDRDTTAYTAYTLSSEVSHAVAIKMYMDITGACAYGTKIFVDSQDVKPSYIISDLISLTANQYGHQTFKQFFEK
jgi:hypothetical protein